MTATMTKPAGSMTCLPRFATPRNHERETLGAQVAEVAARLRIPLLPWQQYVADVAMEIDPDTGQFAYTEIDITVPRQSGKTGLVKAKTVHRLIVLARQFGPQRSLYLAQRGKDAKKKLEQDFAVALRHGRGFPEVANQRCKPKRPTEWKLSMNNGAENISFGSGSYWMIDALSDDAGHSDSLDDLTIDEAWAHEDASIEGDIAPAQAARSRVGYGPQRWIISTAGTPKSRYLWQKVVAGRHACQTGNHGRTAYFEWSAMDSDDPGDPATWRSCSPAMDELITEEFIADEWAKAQRAGPEGIAKFCRGYLNQWAEGVPNLDEDTGPPKWQVITEPQWRAIADPDAGKDGAPVFAVNTAIDHAQSVITVAWRSGDGVLYGPAAAAAGTAWIVDEAVRLNTMYGPAQWVADGKRFPKTKDGTVNSLVHRLEQRGIELQLLAFSEVAPTFGEMLDAVVDQRDRHLDNPLLNEAVELADTRKSGSVLLWADDESGGVLHACGLARMAALAMPAPVQQFYGAWR